MTDETDTDSMRDTAKHIVDILIEERAERLMSNPIIWALVKTLGYPALRYKPAVKMADAIRDLNSAEVMDWASNTLTLDVETTGTEHIPKTGSFIIVSNHPTGIADGVALHDAINPHRKDVSYFANRDAIRVAPKLAENVIPVEWIERKRTLGDSRQTLRAAMKAFRSERGVVFFPSGRLAEKAHGRLCERPWQSTPVNFARKFNCPIIPLHMTGKNSWLYYFLGHVSTELKNMTLFHELLNKKNVHYDLMFGPPIDATDLPDDPDLAIHRLQDFVDFEMASGLSWIAREHSKE